MASSFAAAFNQALRKAQDKIAGVREKRVRKKPKMPTWQESRERFERNKERIAQREKQIGPEEINREAANEPDLAQYRRERAGTSRELVRQAEFDIAVDNDPAFMAWVNRVGAQMGAVVRQGQEITQARLNYLIDLFGVEDAYELYQFVTEFSDFGYKEFQAAYDLDGKNAKEKTDGAYHITRVVSMHMAQVELFKNFPIYEQYRAA